MGRARRPRRARERGQGPRGPRHGRRRGRHGAATGGEGGGAAVSRGLAFRGEKSGGGVPRSEAGAGVRGRPPAVGTRKDDGVDAGTDHGAARVGVSVGGWVARGGRRRQGRDGGCTGRLAGPHRGRGRRNPRRACAGGRGRRRRSRTATVTGQVGRSLTAPPLSLLVEDRGEASASDAPGSRAPGHRDERQATHRAPSSAMAASVSTSLPRTGWCLEGGWQGRRGSEE